LNLNIYCFKAKGGHFEHLKAQLNACCWCCDDM